MFKKTTETTRWEHKVLLEEYSYKSTEAVLNKYGEEGWELIQVIPSKSTLATTYFLKDLKIEARMKPLLLIIAMLFSTPAWAEFPKQVIMECETHTLKYTKGNFIDTVQKREDGDWVNIPGKTENLKYAKLISIKSKVLDYGFKVILKDKVTSSKYFDNFEDKNNFPPKTIITTTYIWDFVLKKKDINIKFVAPNGFTKTLSDTSYCIARK